MLPNINLISGSDSPARYTFSSNHEAAQYWFQFGFQVIPVFPGAKNTCVKWNEWLADLSATKILNHWRNHPRHDLGFIVDENVIVFDADNQLSITALIAIEKAFGVRPFLIVKTTKGVHHYFRHAKGTHAKTDSHSTLEHPDRIDVKATRSLVILPPSTGKSIDIIEANHASYLSEVGQDFIDAVFRHNGRPAPRPVAVLAPSRPPVEASSQNVSRLRIMLPLIDPDIGYDDWIRVLMAIFNTTGGSDEGFDLANDWSSEGDSYKGVQDIRTKWRSFKLDFARPITIGTIYMMIAANGYDWKDIVADAEAQFEVVVDAVEGAE